MIVVDASALLELLLGTERADRLAARLLAHDQRLHAPHLIDIEIASALRRLTVSKNLSVARAGESFADLEAMAIERHAHTDLLPRVWELRNSLSAYDACYVALAEAVDAPLITCDTKLARSHGHRATIEAIA